VSRAVEQRPSRIARKPKEPHFDLAPLTRLDPALIVPVKGDDRFAGFMLALALVFNDLKGVALFGQWLNPGGHPKSPTCGHPKLPHLG
jgi:hypothetical protein